MSEPEELLELRGERSGLPMAIAIHSTLLGPGLGGCRIWQYAHSEDGIDDVLRLAQAMTLKAAAAGLDLGGGKGVVCLPATPISPSRRRAALLDFGDAVESLQGRYITAEDVGSGATDMALIAERTEHVVGLPPQLGGRGDPSPLTARGVERAIRACCEHRYGSCELEEARICVVGLGHVGTALAGRLAAGGAELVVSDIDPSRRIIAERLGMRWVDPEDAARSDCEVLAPCALGGTVTEANVDELRCDVLCGAANNMLAGEPLAERLQERGIVYAPDFIANAGGLIHVYAELQGNGGVQVDDLVDSIGDTVGRVLAEAEEAKATPLDAARELARRRLAGAPAPQAVGTA